VLFAGTAGSSGLTVSVRAGDGFDTSYLHLSTLAVRAGSRVAAGERLGAVGTTGTRSAAQPHLHFGVREAGTRHAYRDPLGFLPPQPPATPAPQPPNPAPAPESAPPVAPAPTPAARSVPDGVPRGAPAPRRVRGPAPAPGPRSVPAPDRVPRPAPASGRFRGPVSASARVFRSDGAPHGTPRPAPSRRLPPREAPGARGGTSTLAGTSVHSSDPARVPASTPPGAHAGTSPSSDGPDIGWALACAGLLLAAGVLGLTDDRPKATRRGSSRLAGALRPRLGRR
jgi:hypothetical protein